MLEAGELPDAERLGRMMHFNLLHSFQLGMFATGQHFDGDDEAITRNGYDVEHADFSGVFEPDPELPESEDDEVKVLN